MGNHEREVCIDKGVVGGALGNRKPPGWEAARFPAADLPPRCGGFYGGKTSVRCMILRAVGVLKSLDTELPVQPIQAGRWLTPRPHSCSASWWRVRCPDHTSSHLLQRASSTWRGEGASGAGTNPAHSSSRSRVWPQEFLLTITL